MFFTTGDPIKVRWVEVVQKIIWNLMDARRNWRGGNGSWGKWKCENSGVKDAHPIFRHTNKKPTWMKWKWMNKKPTILLSKSEGKATVVKSKIEVLDNFVYKVNFNFEKEPWMIFIENVCILSLSKTHEWRKKSCCVSRVVFTQNDICCSMWNIPVWSKYISPSTHMSKGYLFETIPRDSTEWLLSFKLINLLKDELSYFGRQEKKWTLLRSIMWFLCPIVDVFQLISLLIWSFWNCFSRLCEIFPHPEVIIRFFIVSPFNWRIQLRVIQFIVSFGFCMPFLFLVGYFFIFFFFRLQLRREEKIVANR